MPFALGTVDAVSNTNRSPSLHRLADMPGLQVLQIPWVKGTSNRQPATLTNGIQRSILILSADTLGWLTKWVAHGLDYRLALIVGSFGNVQPSMC
jgi:hypothetical protein